MAGFDRGALTGPVKIEAQSVFLYSTTDDASVSLASPGYFDAGARFIPTGSLIVMVFTGGTPRLMGGLVEQNDGTICRIRLAFDSATVGAII